MGLKMLLFDLVFIWLIGWGWEEEEVGKERGREEDAEALVEFGGDEVEDIWEGDISEDILFWEWEDWAEEVGLDVEGDISKDIFVFGKFGLGLKLARMGGFGRMTSAGLEFGWLGGVTSVGKVGLGKWGGLTSAGFGIRGREILHRLKSSLVWF